MSKQFHGNSAAPIDASKLPSNGNLKTTSHPAAPNFKSPTPHPAVTDWRSPAPSTHPALTGTAAGSGAMANLGATPKRIG